MLLLLQFKLDWTATPLPFKKILLNLIIILIFFNQEPIQHACTVHVHKYVDLPFYHVWQFLFG